ncbi:MAG: M20/M25/M40 family metallo-hydrolase [Vicinamibacterales bacterium]
MQGAWSGRILGLAAVVSLAVAWGGAGRDGVRASGLPQAPQDPRLGMSIPDDPDAGVSELVSRITLENYKNTLHGLTRFGDRREGTQRNRDAVEWIAAQLESFGCAPERMTYTPPPRNTGGGRQAAAARGQGRGQQAGRGQGRGQGGQGRGGQGRGAQAPPDLTTPTGGLVGRNGSGPGGSSIFGYRARTGVNNDPENQEDEALRELNMGPVLDPPFPQVYCTKVGSTRPDEMFIVGAHMDGIGYGQAANDDGSGTALVMELARVFNAPGVTTDRSIRFALWNGEEGGLRGATAYVEQRRDLQGREDPPGSGRYPEPKWIAMIQHDMMMWDHGMPRPDGTVSRDQRPEADVNIEFQSSADLADQAMRLAFFFKAANDRYATDYPAAVGPHMTNTDSTPFMNIVPAISLRENERGAQVGAGWDPNWHQVTDVMSTYTDKDFRLGLNAAQTTLAAIAHLSGAKVQ